MKYLLFILVPILSFAQVTEKKFGDVRVRELIPVLSTGSTFTEAVESTLPDSIIYASEVSDSVLSVLPDSIVYTTELGDSASAIRGDFPTYDTTHYIAFNKVIGLQDSINAGGDTTQGSSRSRA